MTILALKENLEKYTRIEECPVRNVLAAFSGKWPVLIQNLRVKVMKNSKLMPGIGRDSTER